MKKLLLIEKLHQFLALIFILSFIIYYFWSPFWFGLLWFGLINLILIAIYIPTLFIKMGIERYIANKLLTFIGNMRYRHKLTDIATAMKSFKIELVNKLDLKANGFDIEPEIVRGLHKNNIEIHEVPIDYYPRTVKEGKKI